MLMLFEACQQLDEAATRIMAELGANVVKCYYTEEGFDTITSCFPVPIVIAGGKKLPELDALKMCYNAINEGANGVDMGRNIFQSDAPIAMMRAVRGVVHENLKPQEGYDLYQTLKAEETEQPAKKGKEKAKA